MVDYKTLLHALIIKAKEAGLCGELADEELATEQIIQRMDQVKQLLQPELLSTDCDVPDCRYGDIPHTWRAHESMLERIQRLQLTRAS